VPSPGDYYDGEIGGLIGRGNRSTRRKPAPVPPYPPQNPLAVPGHEAGSHRWEASDEPLELRHGHTRSPYTRQYVTKGKTIYTQITQKPNIFLIFIYFRI
jgi:hypothetical protein